MVYDIEGKLLELLKVFTGQLGGAIADPAGRIGEVVSVERVPITFTVDGGRGHLTVGAIADAEIAPYTGATGNPTILSETVLLLAGLSVLNG